MKVLVRSISGRIASASSFFLITASLAAQTGPVKMDTMYQCPAGQSFKVYSCTGTANADTCDVQPYSNGQVGPRGRSTYQQVTTVLAICHPQTAAEAQSRGAASATAGPVTGPGGFKVGDKVQVLTGFGWVDGQIQQINGPNYTVMTQAGPAIMKNYPAEIRRIGGPNEADRANGVFQVGERVQVNVEGRWIEGKIETELNNEYHVRLADNRYAWAKAPNLRLSTTPAPTNPKAGTPARPGMTSCAGKIEGRYATTGGFGNMQITFRSGKATITALMGADEEFECWTGGEKIILHKAGESANTDMPIDINNDGTLQTPMGEIKKKGN